MTEPPVEYIELNMRNYNEDDVCQLNEWAIWACEELERLNAKVKHYHNACARQQYDIQGTLAKALGYGGTEEGELPEWGEHIAETLAEEIAAKLAATTQELERLMRHVSEEPNPKTLLPDWAQRLWQALVHLSDKAEFKHIVKHIETLEKELACVTKDRDQLASLVKKISAPAPTEEDLCSGPAIESDPERCGGEPVLAGSRIRVSQMMAALADGWSVDSFAYDMNVSPSLCRKALKELAELRSRAGITTTDGNGGASSHTSQS